MTKKKYNNEYHDVVDAFQHIFSVEELKQTDKDVLNKNVTEISSLIAKARFVFLLFSDYKDDKYISLILALREVCKNSSIETQNNIQLKSNFDLDVFFKEAVILCLAIFEIIFILNTDMLINCSYKNGSLIFTIKIKDTKDKLDAAITLETFDYVKLSLQGIDKGVVLDLDPEKKKIYFEITISS